MLYHIRIGFSRGVRCPLESLKLDPSTFGHQEGLHKNGEEEHPIEQSNRLLQICCWRERLYFPPMPSYRYGPLESIFKTRHSSTLVPEKLGNPVHTHTYRLCARALNNTECPSPSHTLKTTSAWSSTPKITWYASTQCAWFFFWFKILWENNTCIYYYYYAVHCMRFDGKNVSLLFLPDDNVFWSFGSSRPMSAKPIRQDLLSTT